MGDSPRSLIVRATTDATPVTPPGNVAPAFADPTGDAQAWTQGQAIAPVGVPVASGTPTPTYAVFELPAGINYTPATRVISGTPTALGNGVFFVRAINSEGFADWSTSYTVVARRPTRRAETLWAINATMFDNSVDLTPYVAEATWKHGSRPPNHFGHMADPAVGALTLVNSHGGEFRTVRRLTPSLTRQPRFAGAPSNTTGQRLFTGKSGLTLNQVLPSGDIAVMPMFGPLAFLARFAEGIFARLDGVQRTDEVFELGAGRCGLRRPHGN